ncbi:MAG: hypothetical protein ACAI34_22380, partial [Verrucomicrobium sp.]
MKPTFLLTVLATVSLTATTFAADALDAVLVKTAPAGAVSVTAARKEAKAGEPIVVRGRVGGRTASLVDKAAIAVLADEKAVTACNDMPGDACKTPWDYCCETPEKLKASTATIQVRGENGKVLRSTLRGLGGLKELSTVVVKGTVDAAS